MQVQKLYISMVILLYFEIFDFVMIIFDLSNDLLIYTCMARRFIEKPELKSQPVHRRGVP